MNEPAITPQQALSVLEQQQTPESKAIIDYVQAVRDKNIAVLGHDEVFKITDERSEVKAFKRKLVLSKQNGGLIKIWGADQLVVSAQGYEMWQEATGTTVVFPKDVLVGNDWMPNPYVEKDPVNRRVLTVYARAVALGFSAIGVKQASEWTTAFDTPSYRMIDLLAKAKDYPQAFMVMPKELKPATQNNETWASYPFDEAMDLWIDTSHNEVIKWLGQIVNREKKSVDFAQTFAKRNALKHLSGIQKAPHDNWMIPVIAWRQTKGNNAWSISEYNEIQENISTVVEAEDVDLKKGFEKVSEDEVAVVEEVEIDPEDSPEEPGQQEPAVEKPTETQPQAQPAEPSKNVKQAVYLSKNFPTEFDEACKIMNIDSGLAVSDYTDNQAVQICETVAELIDNQN